MAQPTAGDVHVNQPLTNISVAYAQSETNFIASQVFPVVPVDFQTNSYYVYTKNDWFRDEAALRAPATESVGSGYNLSTTSYACKVWSFHKDIDDQTRANSDSMLDQDRSATKLVTQRLLVRRERQWAADHFVASKWGTDVTPANLWSDYAASDPISDVDTGRRAILASTGFEPNTLVLGYDTYLKLKNHPDLISRLAVTGLKTLTTALLGELFEIPRVLVCKAVYATNVELETAAYSFIQGKHALLCYVNPQPELEMPSAGYTFAWRGLTGSQDGLRIKSFRMENIASDRIEGEMAIDAKIVASDLGYFFNGAVA
jgi:hypothetical protein